MSHLEFLLLFLRIFLAVDVNCGRFAGGRESYKVRANGPAVVGSFLTIASSSLGVK